MRQAPRSFSHPHVRQNSHCAHLCSRSLIKIQTVLSHNRLKDTSRKDSIALGRSKEGVLQPFSSTGPVLSYKCYRSPHGKASATTGKRFLPCTDEFEPKTCGETGLLPDGLDGAAICRAYPVAWFQLFRAEPRVSAGVGRGSHPAHIICPSQRLQPPRCASLLASAFTALGGLATTSPLRQTCRLILLTASHH